ncbi:hypothetical protein GCM10027517_21210 [Phycicoccus ginsengisoli]
MSVQPGGLSSLIFVVIIGVWAAYFIQYWVRRREHLATARSVDQFSESMRILERRDPQPASVPAADRTGTAARTSAHAAYGQILLNRAASARVATGTATGAGAGTGGADRDAGTGRQTPAADRAPVASVRRTRSLVMLGALSTAIVAVPLVALSLLPLWALLVPLLSVGGSFTWVRGSVRAEQRARRASRRPVERPVRREDRAPQVARERVVQPRTAHEHTASEAVSVDSGAAVPPHEGGSQEPELRPSRRAEPYDVQAAEAVQPAARAAATAAVVEEVVVPARPLVDEDDIPLTWDPVPVPRPTYTMKARVTRPAPTSADLVGDADTEYAPAEDELPVRRAANA